MDLSIQIPLLVYLIGAIISFVVVIIMNGILKMLKLFQVKPIKDTQNGIK